MVPLKQFNTQSRISLEILQQCSWNLAPEMYITKETKCFEFHFYILSNQLYLFSDDDTSRGSSLLLISSLIFTKTPLKHLALFKTCLLDCFVCFITRVFISSSLGSEIGPIPSFANLQNSFGLGALTLFIFASKQLQLSVSSIFRQLSILRIT